MFINKKKKKNIIIELYGVILKMNLINKMLLFIKMKTILKKKIWIR